MTDKPTRSDKKFIKERAPNWKPIPTVWNEYTNTEKKAAVNNKLKPRPTNRPDFSDLKDDRPLVNPLDIERLQIRKDHERVRAELAKDFADIDKRQNESSTI